LFKYFSGKIPVIFCKPDDMGNITKHHIGEYYVEMCDTLERELFERFGEKNVKFASKGMPKQ